MGTKPIQLEKVEQTEQIMSPSDWAPESMMAGGEKESIITGTDRPSMIGFEGGDKSTRDERLEVQKLSNEIGHLKNQLSSVQVERDQVTRDLREA